MVIFKLLEGRKKKHQYTQFTCSNVNDILFIKFYPHFYRLALLVFKTISVTKLDCRLHRRHYAFFVWNLFLLGLCKKKKKGRYYFFLTTLKKTKKPVI